MRPEIPAFGLPAPEGLSEQLKSAGQQGWELVTVDSALTYCFKRPLR
ncbi:hypothetical protein [Vitiosangium sp. GDMCC 1.1324]|nr:hypothetical protein [Vitiosangium sp. GDMCC 1.1324]